MGSLSSDLDTLASKTISKLCQRIQILVPNFILPGTLGLIDTEHALPGLKRRTRAKRSTAKSSIRSNGSKRRKLTTSTSSIDASERFQSFVLSDVEMQTVIEGRSLASVTPKLGSVYPGRTKASHSVPEVKSVQGDSAEDDTLPAENNAEATQLVRHLQNSLKDSNVVRLKLEPPDPPSSKGRKSLVRPSSRAKNHSLASSERSIVGSPFGEEERLSNFFNKRKSRGSGSKKAKASTSSAQPLAAPESEKIADRSTSVFVNVDATTGGALKGSHGNSGIMTEESDDAVGVTGTQASKSPTRPSKMSPLTVAAAADVTTSATVSTHTAFMSSASQTSSTPAVSVYAENRLRYNRNTPRPLGLSKPWLSRLGWGTAAKNSSNTANATNVVAVTDVTNPDSSHQPQTFRLSAKASVGMGKLKSAITSNASSVVKYAKPTQVVANFAQRLPRISHLNKASGTSKANSQVNEEKEINTAYRSCTSMAAGALSRRAATGPLQMQSATRLLPKNVAEDDRRARVMAKIAESEQRHQELMEKRAMEHRAKMKAANEHRMAVRANAEREAKEKQAATSRRMEVERLKLQKIVIKAKALPPKTAIVASHQSSGQLIKHLPLSSAPINTAMAASTTAGANSVNYIKNFDLAKVAPPPLTPPPPIPSHATVVNESQPSLPPQPPPSPAPQASPVSYDLSGLLSDYDSDSDNEGRYRRRVIPSWAKCGSSDLVFWVSRVYRGEVTWQEVFRPAENVHFEDAELFHGYKFRTRPRGSSAAWNSPTSPPISSHPKTPS
ncbi:hypothetical protein TcWFU_002270 [Taenia crassiceps]|uniref:Inner centromere protein ARK-binding domain-containing protein n=1 Tax=Taenia crassiceps TaxID=6207 RepID=A0ABR4Q624_9CEST